MNLPDLVLYKIWKISNIKEKINLSLTFKCLSHYRYQNIINEPLKFKVDKFGNCTINRTYILFYKSMDYNNIVIQYLNQKYHKNHIHFIINDKLIYHLDKNNCAIRDKNEIIVGVKLTNII